MSRVIEATDLRPGDVLIGMPTDLTVTEVIHEGTDRILVDGITPWGERRVRPISPNTTVAVHRPDSGQTDPNVAHIDRLIKDWLDMADDYDKGAEKLRAEANEQPSSVGYARIQHEVHYYRGKRDAARLAASDLQTLRDRITR